MGAQTSTYDKLSVCFLQDIWLAIGLFLAWYTIGCQTFVVPSGKSLAVRLLPYLPLVKNIDIQDSVKC